VHVYQKNFKYLIYNFGKGDRVKMFYLLNEFTGISTRIEQPK
jgi:hypothetical protein